MVLHAFQPCNGKPAFHATYRSPDFTPEFRQWNKRPRIVAPDTPYVAAAGRHHLYYIDMGFSPEDAAHIKAQVEHTWLMEGDEHIFVDEVEATAEKLNAAGESIFVFDPPYARVLFANFINRRNPGINLPEHAPAGEWLVSYEPRNEGTGDKGSLERREVCSDHGCNHNSDCARYLKGACEACITSKVDNECALSQPDSIGICHPLCGRKVDTPRFEGETDADYYQRMDKLHWGDKKVRIPATEGSNEHT
ncbi:hypothetical protein CC79DRAFT_1366540 [Sarocladium strictum]